MRRTVGPPNSDWDSVMCPPTVPATHSLPLRPDLSESDVATRASRLDEPPGPGVPERALGGRVVLDVDEVLAPGQEARRLVEGDRGELGPEPPVDLVAEVGRPGRVQLAGGRRGEG